MTNPTTPCVGTILAQALNLSDRHLEELIERLLDPQELPASIADNVADFALHYVADLHAATSDEPGSFDRGAWIRTRVWSIHHAFCQEEAARKRAAEDHHTEEVELADELTEAADDGAVVEGFSSFVAVGQVEAVSVTVRDNDERSYVVTVGAGQRADVAVGDRTALRCRLDPAGAGGYRLNLDAVLRKDEPQPRAMVVGSGR